MWLIAKIWQFILLTTLDNNHQLIVTPRPFLVPAW